MNFSYIYQIRNTKRIMLLVIIACIPAIIVKCYFFGSGTLIQILFSVAITYLLEVIFLKIRSKNINVNLYDNSSILISILFAISIPSLLPWWMTIIGIFFSIVISKNLYGGIGQNIFNPAMIGYVILLISFPLDMSHWNKRNSSLSFYNDIAYSFKSIFLKEETCSIEHAESNLCPDIFTEATPLNKFKTKSHLKNDYSLENLKLPNDRITIASSWKYINVSFLLGGIFLLYQKIICWRIPLSFLTILGFFSGVTYLYSKILFISPYLHFFSGGTMICAFFIATDPVTTACTNAGKIIFGSVIGFLVFIIRNYSDYPDAIAFSVLFGNMIVPLIDYYIKTSGYGHK